MLLPEVLVWPFIASLVLAGIHVYFGIHVIARNVIFVDLAIAQMAALGAVVGIVLGYEHGSEELAIYLYSLAFTFLGAVIFTFSRSKKQAVPLEAIIGITYTAAFAVTLMILSKSPIGSHELDRILKGDILWAEKGKVVITAAVYTAVGAFHYFMRRKFFDVTERYSVGGEGSASMLLTDLLFYMTFGVVVASSVSLVGVFLVFSYLVIPSVTSILVFPDVKRRLIFGWIIALVVSFAGMRLSYTYELPSTPLIVILLTISLIGVAIVRKFVLAQDKKGFIVRLSVGACALTLFVFCLYQFRPDKGHDELKHLLEHGTSQERVHALKMLRHEEVIDTYCAEWIRKFARSDDTQVKIAVCELLKGRPAGEWKDEILAMLSGAKGELLSCLLDLARRRRIDGVEEKMLAMAGTDGPYDARLEIFSALLYMHNESVVDCMLKDYGSFPVLLQDDILELLNSHYHVKTKTIDEFRAWYMKQRMK